MLKTFFTAVILIFSTSSALAAEYEIDGSHSTVGFKIKHLAISSVTGKFSDFTGHFSFDPKNVAASKAEATISVKSIDTDEPKRDDHLRGSDFFDTEKFPQMTFKSSEVIPGNDGEFKVHGDLTIHGVTKKVTLDAKFEGEATDPWGKQRAGFTATTKLNRRDFGLTWSKVIETGALVVGDEVTVMIEVEGVKKQ